MCDGMDEEKEFFIKKAHEKEEKLMHKEFSHSTR
jgi:hypothetical protein